MDIFRKNTVEKTPDILRDPLIFYSVILGRCFNKWESHEQDIFVHPKPPN